MPFEGGRASALIGPEGGSLELGEVILDIPAGALAEEMEIGVEASPFELDGLSPLSAAYAFSPSGLTFAIPVQLSFELEHGAPGAKLYHGEDLSMPPVEVAGATIRDSRVDAMITGFSYYVVGTHTNPIIDVDEGFDFEGAHYTAGPVSQGIIKGFSYSFADGAGVTDGEGMGHVWYHDGYCMTFRPDGTGVMDLAGGTDQRFNELPWIQVDPSPGEAENAAPAPSEGMEPAGTRLLDPEYDRTSELVEFRWGVRLNADDTIYEDFSGTYETRVEFEDDGIPASTLAWDPVRNTHAGSVPGYNEMTTELPADNHFCTFREVVSMNASADQSRCVQTVEEYSGGLSFTKSVCYSHGVVQGPYSMTDMNGVEIESGTFENNRPVGGWMYRTLEGVLEATGTYDADGMPQGEWRFYDWQGNPSTVATFKGGYEPSVVGTYQRTLNGPFESYGSSSNGGTFLQRKGSLLDGKRSGPWQSFDEDGVLTGEDNYDAATQIPNGESCYSLAEGGFECIPITSSWRNNSFSYDWGGCVSGVNKLTFVTYDMSDSIATMECFEMQGTQQEPEKGPMMSCGTACQQ